VPNSYSFDQQSYALKQVLQFKWEVDSSGVPEFSLILLVFELIVLSPAITARLHQPVEECPSDRFLSIHSKLCFDSFIVMKIFD